MASKKQPELPQIATPDRRAKQQAMDRYQNGSRIFESDANPIKKESESPSCSTRQTQMPPPPPPPRITPPPASSDQTESSGSSSGSSSSNSSPNSNSSDSTSGQAAAKPTEISGTQLDDGELKDALKMLGSYQPGHPYFNASIDVLASHHLSRMVTDPRPVAKQARWLKKKLKSSGIRKPGREPVFRALRDFESTRIANWLRDKFKDEELLSISCNRVLADLGNRADNGNTQQMAKETMPVNSSKPQQSNALDKALRSLTPVTTTSEADSDFDFEAFERQSPEDRTRLALKYFPDARTFFGHHALRHQFSVPWFHKIEEDDACQRVDAVWDALSEADTQDWETLLHRSHKQGDLLLDEAASLLSRQGVAESLLPQSSGQADMKEDDVAAQEQVQVESATDPAQAQPLPKQNNESATGSTPNLGQLTVASRPNMVRFVRWYSKPGTFTVLLPIGTPECPVSDAFPAEVQDACRIAFGDTSALEPPSVHRLGPNAWIAQMARWPQSISLTAYISTRTLRLRAYTFRAFAAPKFPPIRFEADFSEASDVLSFEVANHIRSVFASPERHLPEIREESRAPAGRRFVVTFSTAPDLFCFYLLIRAVHNRAFIAIFRPRYVKGLCWMCEVRHEGGSCPRSKLVPYPS